MLESSFLDLHHEPPVPGQIKPDYVSGRVLTKRELFAGSHQTSASILEAPLVKASHNGTFRVSSKHKLLANKQGLATQSHYANG